MPIAQNEQTDDREGCETGDHHSPDHRREADAGRSHDEEGEPQAAERREHHDRARCELRPEAVFLMAHAAQQESVATSRAKVWAASLRPSAIVR